MKTNRKKIEGEEEVIYYAPASWWKLLLINLERKGEAFGQPENKYICDF